MVPIGPTIGSIAMFLRMPMQYLESIIRLFSLTLMSCWRADRVLRRRTRASSARRNFSLSTRTDSRISWTSFWSLWTKKGILLSFALTGVNFACGRGAEITAKKSDISLLLHRFKLVKISIVIYAQIPVISWHTYPSMTGSRQSSTLILRVLSSSRVWASFIGYSLSQIAFLNRAAAFSVSWMLLFVWIKIFLIMQSIRGPVKRMIDLGNKL